MLLPSSFSSTRFHCSTWVSATGRDTAAAQAVRGTRCARGGRQFRASARQQVYDRRDHAGERNDHQRPSLPPEAPASSCRTRLAPSGNNGWCNSSRAAALYSEAGSSSAGRAKLDLTAGGSRAACASRLNAGGETSACTRLAPAGYSLRTLACVDSRLRRPPPSGSARELGPSASTNATVANPRCGCARTATRRCLGG